MRLADFILGNIEPILAEWEVFARSISPGAMMNQLALRDHAADILRATALDMVSAQSATERSDKSKGHGASGAKSRGLDGASAEHAVGRVDSGFDLIELVAEYRALRASVLRLWRASSPAPDERDLDDLTRFNESIDQSLTKAISSYTKRVDQSREMFLAILGHDLRNPLNTITMSAEVLKHGGQLDAESSEVASQISASAAVMAKMIGDLLDYTRSRLGAGMPTSPAAMDLADLCREVLEEFRAGHPARTLRFQSSTSVTGEWDAARLRQAVSNLLANAIQHGGEGAAIDLSLSVEGSKVLIAVQNEGRPIPPDALPTIFDPLVRGVSPGSEKQRRPGSIGLGLYIAREVVTAHGGSIDVKSSAEEGTVFTIRLPRHRGAPLAVAPPAPATMLEHAA